MVAAPALLGDYLKILATSPQPEQREMAAKALLAELTSGATVTVADRAALEARYAIEDDIGVAGLIRRALTRLRTQDVLDAADPTSRFDRKLSSGERERLAGLVARLRVVVDEVQGSGEFDSRYEVVEEITEGGMGRILRGRRRTDGAPVAIKVLLEEHATNESFRARFRREGQMLQRLDHPHIVKLYEWGEIGGRIYLVMEHLGGGDLAGAAGQLAPREAASALLQTLDALAACHAAGIIHRDVKPGNLFVQEPGAVRVKLGDFGLARDVDAPHGLTREWALMGTMPYMAPEQREDPTRVGPAADVHAFGVTAYELLSGGRLPVDNHPPLSALARGVPPELDDAIGRCLARRPDDRPDVRSLQRAFTPFASDP